MTSEEPVYSTPDPHLRPLSPEGSALTRPLDEDEWLSVMQRIVAGELEQPPICQLLGIRMVEAEAASPISSAWRVE